MQGGTEQPEGFVLVLTPSARLVPPSIVDTLVELSPDESFGGVPVALFFARSARLRGAGPTIGDIVLHAALRIDLKFLWVDRSSQPPIVLSRVFAFGIALWIVNVFGGQVASESFGRNLKLGRGVSVREKSKYHAHIDNGLQVCLG